MTLGPKIASDRIQTRRRHGSRFPALLLILLFTLGLSACGGSGETGDGAEAMPPPVAEAVSGECVLDPPAEAMACTMQYDPVCGCDGTTYGNACMARGAGVPSFEPGECPGNAE